ncbi:MAG: type VI secretion system ATPase TssH [Desulfovibrionaceae bacterium]|nr:type VI secretion system ATPase TssH [Desulfovibrionaceae bacterium]
MIGVDMKGLIGKCSSYCLQKLNAAAGSAVNRAQYEITVEHFLLACLEDETSDISLICLSSGIDTGRLKGALNRTLEEFRSGNTGRPVFSPALQDLLEASWLVASVDLGLTQIRSGAVLLTFLRRPSMYAQGGYTTDLSTINRDTLQQNFASLTSSSSEHLIEPDEKAASALQPGTARTGESFIAKYCEDFTLKAKAGKIDPVFGRDQEIRSMVDILARRRKNNPILVGEPGVGKTAVMEGLALRITEGDVPDTLQGVSLLGLDMGLLEAGASVKGEFERRLKGVLDEIRSSEKPIVLFIDEAHLLVGAGNASGGSDAANLMKPALARGEIRTCAATTWKEYKKYFEKDPALARRFQLVKLDEPSVPVTKLILRGLRAGYEKHHGILIREDAIECAAEFSSRYISGRFQPDKAIDLLDTACARVRVGLAAKPAELEDTQRLTQAKERELAALQRDEDNGVTVDAERKSCLLREIEELKEKDAVLTERWQKEQEAARRLIEARTVLQDAVIRRQEGEETADLPSREEALAQFSACKRELENVQGDHPMIAVEVTDEVIARVVSDWTGIPVGRVAREQAAQIADLETTLKQRIKGQDAAIRAITEGIQSSKAGLRSPSQPIGCYLLTGPSGVGKTESGLALAEALFGDERSVITINMSEFQEKHTVSRLIGSPPGYVGYGEGGMLTEAVRRKPYSVVLLDETEKAHPDVMQLFYQVFDKGVLTDGEGTEVNFRNTVIMMTSNLGSDVIQEMTTDPENPADTESLSAALRPLLSAHFKPALLARMQIVPFVSLNAEALRRITALKLKTLADRLYANNGLQFSWSSEAEQTIADRCTETETGARNIDFILSGTLLPQLSRRILEQMAGGNLPEQALLGIDENGEFQVTFSNSGE